MTPLQGVTLLIALASIPVILFVSYTKFTANYNQPPPPLRSSSSRKRRPPTFTRPNRILFYHRSEPYYEFTNFSPHPVEFEGKTYPTAEHLFQSFKFQDHRPDIAEQIRTVSPFPRDAFMEARKNQINVRSNWLNVNVEKMDETLWYKFTQHADLGELLLSTGSAELVENSDKDAFWGIGADGAGRNELGKALMRLRQNLLQHPETFNQGDVEVMLESD